MFGVFLFDVLGFQWCEQQLVGCCGVYFWLEVIDQMTISSWKHCNRFQCLHSKVKLNWVKLRQTQRLGYVQCFDDVVISLVYWVEQLQSTNNIPHNRNECHKSRIQLPQNSPNETHKLRLNGVLNGHSSHVQESIRIQLFSIYISNRNIPKQTIISNRFIISI